MSDAPIEPAIVDVEEIPPDGLRDPKLVRGTRAHVPTQKTRNTVKFMAAAGRPQSEIAKALKICAPTLRDHYREELDTAVAEMNGIVLTKMFKLIMIDENPQMIALYARSKLGFKETTVLEAQARGATTGDTKMLTDERIRQIVEEVKDDL